MELSPDQLDVLFDAHVVDSGGDKVGTVGQIYLDDVTERLSFITVRTGLFGTRESFIPVRGIVLDGETVTLPWTRDHIRDAPEVATEGHLDEADQTALWTHYGVEPAPSEPPATGAGHSGRATTTEGITVVGAEPDTSSADSPTAPTKETP